MTELIAHPGPDWVVSEMPAGYQNRLMEIQRLVADLHEMGQFARLLYEVGPQLGEAVRDVFTAMKFDTELVPWPSAATVTVSLENRSRLLLVPAAATQAIQKKSPELAQAFNMLQEVAGDSDRVVLVTNVDPQTPPAERPPAITPDALSLLVRMGVVHVTGSTLFNLWKMSLQGLDRARKQIDRLHAHEAGTFELSASALR